MPSPLSPQPYDTLPAPAAAIAILATLALGWVGRPLGLAAPGVAGLVERLPALGVMVGGLAAIVAVGLLAYLLAALTACPAARKPHGEAMLPAALLTAALVPGLGAPAILPGLLLAAWGTRATALLAMGAALSLAIPGLAADCIGAALAIAAALTGLRETLAIAANDNPLLKRFDPNWRLPRRAPYATAHETRIRGIVINEYVQQQR